MSLVFDFGNTTQKMAAMLSGEVIDMVKKTKIETTDIEQFLEKYNPKHAILSSVVNGTEEVVDFLEKRIFLLRFSHKTPIPIQNEYKTPDSLGTDRLACAVAAASLFPKTAVLALQMGTCITSDFITASGVYKGGSISPGLEMRLHALHHFSAKLPLLSYTSPHPSPKTPPLTPPKEGNTPSPLGRAGVGCKKTLSEPPPKKVF